MKTLKAITTLESLGGVVDHRIGKVVYVNFDAINYEVSFWDQDSEAFGFNLRAYTDVSDVDHDYFAGVQINNLKNLVKMIENIIETKALSKERKIILAA